MIDIGFYQNYHSMVTSSNQESIKHELAKNTQEMYENDFVSLFDLKMNTDYFKSQAVVNNAMEIECVFAYKKFKEPTINANGLEIFTEPNVIKSGDYVTMKFNYNKDMEERTYIVSTTVQHEHGHDKAILSLCNHEFNIMGKDGSINRIYASVSDSKLMIKDSSIGSVEDQGASSIWLTVQANNYTNMLAKEVKRVMVNTFPYSIVDVSRLMATKHIYTVGLKNDIENPKDTSDIAYNDYMDIIKPTPNPTSIIGDSDLYFYDENTYSVDTSNMAIWSCVDTFVQFVNTTNNSCIIKVDYDSKLINKIIILVATINGVRYEKSIKLRNS